MELGLLSETKWKLIWSPGNYDDELAIKENVKDHHYQYGLTRTFREPFLPEFESGHLAISCHEPLSLVYGDNI